MTDQEPQERLRSINIISLLSPRPAWRLMKGIARAPFDSRYAGSPLAVCWFTNFSCNAKCPFCCKAAEIRAGKERFPPLPLERARELLARIRRSVNLLYLSGGEPTIHPQIIELLEAARALNFSSVGISTNLIALDRKPEIIELVDAIGCSIHSPDVEVHARNLGVPVKNAERAFRNLELLEERARSGELKVLVNCVINPRNLDTVLEMVEFTRERGFLLEVVPANDCGRTPKELHENPEYLALIDELIRVRKSGQASHLAGSTHYYETIRDFKPYRCFPYGVANIMPDGRLCTPCDVAEQYAVNVLDHKDLKAAVKASLPQLGDYPCRAGECFKAGIVERSRLFGLLVSGASGKRVDSE